MCIRSVCEMFQDNQHLCCLRSGAFVAGFHSTSPNSRLKHDPSSVTPASTQRQQATSQLSDSCQVKTKDYSLVCSIELFTLNRTKSKRQIKDPIQSKTRYQVFRVKHFIKFSLHSVSTCFDCGIQLNVYFVINKDKIVSILNRGLSV